MQVVEQNETAKKRVQRDSTKILSVLPLSTATTLQSAHTALQQAWFPWGSPGQFLTYLTLFTHCMFQLLNY